MNRGRKSCQTDRDKHMSKRSILLGTTAAVTLLVVTALIVLAPGNPAPFPIAAHIDETEHAHTIDALRPPKRKRPVIAIITLNDATEVTDLLVPYGVLSHANIADVTVVAERANPVPLHPFSTRGRGPELLRVEPSQPPALSTSATRRVPTMSSFPRSSPATISTSWIGSWLSTARERRYSLYALAL